MRGRKRKDERKRDQGGKKRQPRRDSKKDIKTGRKKRRKNTHTFSENQDVLDKKTL